MNNRNNHSPKVVYNYYGEKDLIKPICHIRNVKVPSGLMTQVSRSPYANPKGFNISWISKLSF